MKAIVAAVLLVPALALAQVPGVMSFQGRLLKPDGSAETGSPSIRFAIYATGEGGESIWHEDQTVALSNGFYSVKLGASTAFPPNLFDGSARWLGVTVGLGTELAPRQYIATVPYAFKAATADSATTAGKATTADGAPWSGVTGKPGSFPPSSHSHAGSDVTSPVAAATSLSANGSNCGAGQAALGVDAQGNAEGCWAVTTLPGRVVGGYTPANGCGSSGCSTCCAAWGFATCNNCYGTTVTCSNGSVLRGNFCISQ